MNQNVATVAATVAATETFSEMVLRLFKNMDSVAATRLHAAVGISGEAAEILNAVNNDNPVNFLEEMGDMRFYMEKLFLMTGVSYTLLTEGSIVSGYHKTLHGRLTDILVVAAGEILDLAKKSWVYGKEFHADAMREQCIVLVSVYNELLVGANLTDSDVTDANQWKLTLAPNARYKLGYSDAAAIARADKVEPAYAKTEFKHVWQNTVTGKFHFSDEAEQIEPAEYETAVDAHAALGHYVDSVLNNQKDAPEKPNNDSITRTHVQGAFDALPVG